MVCMRGSKLSFVAQKPLARGSAPLHPQIAIEQYAAAAEATARPALQPTEAAAAATPPRTVTRLRVVAVRVSQQEFDVIDANARDAGLSVSSYLRKRAIGTAGPRARRKPTVNAELMAYAIAQLNRAGNLLNQIAKRLHGSLPIASTEIDAAARDTRYAVRLICRSLGID